MSEPRDDVVSGNVWPEPGECELCGAVVEYLGDKLCPTCMVRREKERSD